MGSRSLWLNFTPLHELRPLRLNNLAPVMVAP